MEKIKVTVWNEYLHEVSDEKIGKIYPTGIHNCIADFLKEAGFDTKTATLNMLEHGLTEEVLNETDVLVWWGHQAHDRVEDEIVERVHAKILDGMGLIVLHSAFQSKIFNKICGTQNLDLKWRVGDDKSILWVIDPTHPIVDGLDEKIILDKEEMYGETFHIPTPDALVFISWFAGGEVLRSGCCYSRGKGKIFYFQPGHETYPTYYNKEIQKVICNAVQWAKKTNPPSANCGKSKPVI